MKLGRHAAALVEAWRRVDATRLALLPGLTGLLTGVAAIGFVELLNLVQFFAIGSTHHPLDVLPGLAWYHVVLAPAIGGLIVGPLLRILAPEAAGHGVPEVIEAVTVGGGQIRRRVALVKSVASALTIGSGGSLGREGPIVQIGAAVGSAVGQILRLPAEQLRTLAACGAAAGIAAVFNAPIAGAFFALEVITGNFAMPAFGPVILASVLGTVVSRAYFGDHPAFIVQPYELESLWEIGTYAALGILCGIVGAVFIGAIGRMEQWAASTPIPRIWRPAAGGLLLGFLILVVPDLYGVGYGTMDAALSGTTPWHWLALLLPLKILATSLTLASGGSGGVFIPALYIGAVTGGLVGSGVHALLPSVTAGAGAYALVGMAGVLSAATHSPITAMILLFEMSGDYQIILPVMIVVTLSTAVGRSLAEDSLYTAALRRRGILVDRREDQIMRRHRVGEAMRPAPQALSSDAPMADLVRHFLERGDAAAYVEDEAGRYVGVVSMHRILDREVRDLGDLVRARDVAETNALRVSPGDTLAACMDRFVLSERDELPVVDADGRLAGVISRRDVLGVYNSELLRHEFLAARTADGETDRAGGIRLGDGVTIARVPAPTSLLGRSLRDADLRATHGLTVVAVQCVGESQDRLPDPERPLAAGDILLVAGTPEHLTEFSRRA